MPGRSGGDYRYGFNGKEKDKDGEFGSLTHYDYGFRIYNPGVGRFLSVDPLSSSYPWYTPYQFAGNKPIVATDIDGLEENPSVENVFLTRAILKTACSRELLFKASESSKNARLKHWWQRAHNLDNNTGNSRFNALKGTAGEAIAGERLSGWASNLILASAFHSVYTSGIVTFSLTYNYLKSDKLGDTWDMQVTFRKILGWNRRGLILVGYNYEGTHHTNTQYFDFNASGRINIKVEVKTFSPSRESSSLISAYVDGLQQTMNHKSNGDYLMFVTDKAAWQKAVEGDASGKLRSVFSRFVNQGGILDLVDDLHEDAKNLAGETVKKIRNSTTDKTAY